MATKTIKKTETESFQFDNEKHIVIAQKVYEREALGDDIRAVISHINHSDQEIATAEANVRVFKLGRDEMVKQLITKLEEDKVAPVALVPDSTEGESGDD
ncbi:DUF6447 family protein [Vulcanococcus sp.]|uniref:DUF6447 family protein n=1 Tax=Vulcanococcus sp. TaxID=2856995 RepID=UPI003C049713